MSDYLTEEEQVARLRAWWKENGTFTVVGVALVVAAVVGWRWYQDDRQTRLFATSDVYEAYREAAAGQRDELAARIVEQGSGTAYPSLVLLEQADEAVAGGDLAAAEPLLTRAIEVASGAELESLARLRLARLLFAADRADDALGVLAQVRGEGFLALAAELKGDIHVARDERALAHQSYTTALGYIAAGDQRPILELKAADTADAGES